MFFLIIFWFIIIIVVVVVCFRFYFSLVVGLIWGGLVSVYSSFYFLVGFSVEVIWDFSVLLLFLDFGGICRRLIFFFGFFFIFFAYFGWFWGIFSVIFFSFCWFWGNIRVIFTIFFVNFGWFCDFPILSFFLFRNLSRVCLIFSLFIRFCRLNSGFSIIFLLFFFFLVVFFLGYISRINFFLNSFKRCKFFEIILRNKRQQMVSINFKPGQELNLIRKGEFYFEKFTFFSFFYLFLND